MHTWLAKIKGDHDRIWQLQFSEICPHAKLQGVYIEQIN